MSKEQEELLDKARKGKLTPMDALSNMSASRCPIRDGEEKAVREREISNQ